MTHNMLSYRYGIPEWLATHGIAYERKTHPYFSFYYNHKPVNTPVSRMAFILHGRNEIFHGASFCVCHKCDFGPCCNYSHLSLGSAADNGHDKTGKNVYGKGMQPIMLPDGVVHPLLY
jgi:hypothetical protein